MTYKERFNRKKLARRVLAACLAIGFVVAPAGAMAASSFTGQNVSIYDMTSSDTQPDNPTIQKNGNIYTIYAQDVDIEHDIALNKFNTFELGADDKAVMKFNNNKSEFREPSNLINLVKGQIQINGTLAAMRDSKISGNLYFLSSKGMVVGPMGAINAGSLTVLTPTQDKMTEYFSRNAANFADFNSQIDNIPLYQNGSVTTDAQNAEGSTEGLIKPGVIELKKGAKINTSGNVDLRSNSMLLLTGSQITTGLSDKAFGELVSTQYLGISPEYQEDTKPGTGGIKLEAAEGIYAVDPNSLADNTSHPGVALTTHSGAIEIISSGDIVELNGLQGENVDLRKGNINVGNIMSDSGNITITSSGQLNIDSTNHNISVGSLNIEKGNINVGTINSAGNVTINSNNNAVNGNEARSIVNISGDSWEDIENHNVHVKIGNIAVGDIGDINSAGAVEITNKADNETVPEYNITLSPGSSGKKYNEVGVDISNVTIGDISSKSDVKIINAFEDKITVKDTEKSTVTIGTTSIGNGRNFFSISSYGGDVNITTSDSLKTGGIFSNGYVVIENKISNSNSLDGRYKPNVEGEGNDNKRIDIKTGAITSGGSISLTNNNGYGSIIVNGEIVTTGGVTIKTGKLNDGVYYDKTIETQKITATGKNDEGQGVSISGNSDIEVGTIESTTGGIKLDAQSQRDEPGAKEYKYSSIKLKNSSDYISAPAPEEFENTNGMSGGQVSIVLSSTDSLGSKDKYIKIEKGVVSASASDKNIYIEATEDDKPLNIKTANGKNISLRGKTVNVGELALSVQRYATPADSITIEAEEITHYGNTDLNNVNYLAAKQLNLTAKNEKGLTVTLNNNAKDSTEDFYDHLGTINIEAKGNTTLNYDMGSRAKTAKVNIINTGESSDVEVNIKGGSLNLNSPLSTKGNITLNADKGITAGDLQTTGNEKIITVTSTGGDAVLNNVNAATASIKAEKGNVQASTVDVQDLTLNAKNIAVKEMNNVYRLDYTANGNLALSKLVDTNNSDIQDLSVTSKDGKVTADVEMQKAEKVNLKGEQVDVTKSLDAKDITLNGGDVNVNAELSAEQIGVDGKQVDINEALDAKDITLNGGDVNVNAELSAEQIGVEGKQVDINGALHADKNVNIDGDAVEVKSEITSEKGDVNVTAQNGLNMTQDANIKAQNGTISLTNNGDKVLNATNMEAKNVSVTQNGNADTNISNVKADELNVTQNGNGDAAVKDTRATTLNITHNAIGDVKVNNASGTNMTVKVNDGDMQSTGVNFANVSVSLPINRILGDAKEYEYDLADWMRMTLDRDYYDLREGDELLGVSYYERYDLVQDDSKQQDEEPAARYEGLHNATEEELIIKA